MLKIGQRVEFLHVAKPPMYGTVTDYYVDECARYSYHVKVDELALGLSPYGLIEGIHIRAVGALFQ